MTNKKDEGIDIKGPKWMEYAYGIGGRINAPEFSRYYDVRNKCENIQMLTRHYLNKTSQMFEYDNLPDTIKKHDLEQMVQGKGFGTWLVHNGKLYVLDGSIGGEPDPNGKPTRAMGGNAALNMTYDLKIDEECVVEKNDSNYQGLYPIITKNATLLVENELSIYITLVNSRSQTILSAGDDNTIESAREYLKKLEAGEFGVIVNPKWAGQSDAGINIDMGAGQTTTNSLIALIELEQYIKGSLEMTLGLRAPFNMKREALGDSEVSQTDVSILPLVDDMLYCREKAIEKVNELFSDYLPNGPIVVRLSGAWAKIREEMNRREEMEENNALMDDDAEDDETIEEVTEGAQKAPEATEQENTQQDDKEPTQDEDGTEEREDDDKKKDN